MGPFCTFGHAKQLFCGKSVKHWTNFSGMLRALRALVQTLVIDRKAVQKYT